MKTLKLDFINAKSYIIGLPNTRIVAENQQIPMSYLPGSEPRGGSGILRKGAHLKKMRRAEGGAKNFGVFRVKNHDFTPKNHIFSNIRHILIKDHI